MTLAEIYAKIPDVRCLGKCQEACGPIAMSRREAKVVAAASCGAVTTREIDDISMVDNYDKKTFQCSALKHGRCSIYAHRPLICRLWGAVKAMRCPFGCRPKRWLSDAEASSLLKQAGEATE